MASQGSQSSSSPRICLSLLKFSYATAAEGTSAPIPWKHIVAANDLSVVLDTIDISGPAGAVEKRQRFQVFQGNDVLEDIDLDILASEARKASDEPHSIQANRAFSLITVIARLPCVAMRYPLAGGRVRRFQVRFADAEGFYEMMKRLSKAGVPVVEAESAPAACTPSPGLPNGTGAVLQQPIHTLHNDHRPATATRYDYTTNKFGSTFAGSMQDASIRPASSGTMPSYGQHRLINNSPYLNDANPLNREISFIPLVQEARAASGPRDVSPWINRSVTPAIDLYTPRPPFSSAPESHIQEKAMPPKRDLPFSRKPRKGEGSTQVPRPALAPISLIDKMQPPTLSDITGVDEIVTNAAEEQTAPGDQKRPVAKPHKEPAPKKARTTNARKKAVPKSGRQTKAVPSVEELVREKMAQQEVTTTGQATIDTQELIDQAESMLQASKSKVLPETHAASDTNMAAKPDEPVPRLDFDVPAPLAARTNRDLSSIGSKHVNRSEERIQCDARPLQVMDDPTSTAAFTQPINVDMPRANSHTGEEGLTREAKQSAIETWICEQIDDEEFMKVCKMVESVWARAFVRF